jgi:hypothetical protein
MTIFLKKYQEWLNLAKKGDFEFMIFFFGTLYIVRIDIEDIVTYLYNSQFFSIFHAWTVY